MYIEVKYPTDVIQNNGKIQLVPKLEAALLIQKTIKLPKSLNPHNF